MKLFKAEVTVRFYAADQHDARRRLSLAGVKDVDAVSLSPCRPTEAPSNPFLSPEAGRPVHQQDFEPLFDGASA